MVEQGKKSAHTHTHSKKRECVGAIHLCLLRLLLPRNDAGTHWGITVGANIVYPGAGNGPPWSVGLTRRFTPAPARTGNSNWKACSLASTRSARCFCAAPLAKLHTTHFHQHTRAHTHTGVHARTHARILFHPRSLLLAVSWFD